MNLSSHQHQHQHQHHHQQQQQQQPLHFGSNGTQNAAWNQRPALEMVGSDELKNLERVLMMNWSTMQQQPAASSLGEGLPMNPYLLQMMQTAHHHHHHQQQQQQLSVQSIPVTQSPPQPRHATNPSEDQANGSNGVGPNGRARSNSSLSTNEGGSSQQQQQQQQQQQGFQPVIQYPFVPFWTACPLPFSPLAYPQIIMPPAALAPQQIGPQLLRPINWQQMSLPNFHHQAPPSSSSSSQLHRSQSTPSQPPTPRSTSTATTPAHTPRHQPTPQSPQLYPSSLPLPMDKKSEYAEKLERYREKRMKRKWSRMPDQRLSQAAQNRPRDECGKFTSDEKAAAMSSHEASQKASSLQKQLDELMQQLSRSQYESKLLREKLVQTERELGLLRTSHSSPKSIPDDMYQRQVITHAQASQPDLYACADDGIIYSPFKGGNAILSAFKEKVDFSQKKQDLRPINSPFLSKESFLSLLDASRVDGRESGGRNNCERGGGESDQERRLEFERLAMQTDQWVEDFLLENGEPSHDGEELVDSMNYGGVSFYTGS